jgi:hypothetical protein
MNILIKLTSIVALVIAPFINEGAAGHAGAESCHGTEMHAGGAEGKSCCASMGAAADTTVAASGAEKACCADGKADKGATKESCDHGDHGAEHHGGH